MPVGQESNLTVDTIAGRVVPIPRGVPQAAAQLVVNYYRRRADAVLDGAGVAEVDLGAPPAGWWWLVDRVVVTTTSALATVARTYVGSAHLSNLEDVTPAGNEDVAEYPRGLYVAGGAPLVVRWTGGTPGARAYASAQVAETRA